MKKYLIIIIAAISCVVCQSSTQKKIRLSFNSDGTFKIAQFTDMHLISGSSNTATTLATIKFVLEAEKPDVAILTGDQVIDEPSQAMWPLIAKVFDEAQIPFAVVFGNHDAETITRAEAYELLSQSPYFLGERGPKDIYGYGNYVLPVRASKSDKVAALLYCFDSNDYSAYGYDWIHYDQINWYRQQSQAYTKANDGNPLPALAFFHIPLLEYFNTAGKVTTYGTRNEGGSPAKLNTGMFAAIKEMGDVKGVFVGHDHDNDFIGMDYGVALAYGRVTGADAYGSLERGGRIIELTENATAFTTWIRTPKAGAHQIYYYPSGINGEQEATAVYAPALNVNPAKQGVAYKYYEGEFNSVDDLAKVKVVKQGTQNDFSIKDAAAGDHFGYEFHTLIKVPEKSIYYFYTTSDDGSKLYVDGKLVVNNDGSHSAKKASSTAVSLDAGFHDLRLLYFDDYSEQKLEAGVLSKSIAETIIPAEWLYLPE